MGRQLNAEGILGVYRTSDYGGFAPALLQAIADGGGVVWIADQEPVHASVTTPANVTLRFSGGQLSPDAGVTLTIGGPIEAGASQIFGGAGTVALGHGACLEFLAEWWGAKGDAGTDDTAAIQLALNAAGELSGQNFTSTNTYFGTVDVLLQTSKAGYLCAGTLSVPDGVRLRGTGSAAPLGGAILLTTNSAGGATGTPFITLGANAGLQDVIVYWPYQGTTSASVVAYPWAIQGTALDPFLRNVTLLNPYQAINMPPGVGRFFIDGLYAQPLHIGLQYDGLTDFSRINNVQFSPIWHIDAVGSGGIFDYQIANLTGINGGRADNILVSNYAIYNCQYGINLLTLTSGSTWGQFVNCAVDGAKIGLLVSSVSQIGALFTNCWFNATNGLNKTPVYVSAGNNGHLGFINCRLTGAGADQYVRSDVPDGNTCTAAFVGCRIGTETDTTTTGVMITAEGLSFRFQDCEFRQQGGNVLDVSALSGAIANPPHLRDCVYLYGRIIANPNHVTIVEDGNTQGTALIAPSLSVSTYTTTATLTDTDHRVWTDATAGSFVVTLPSAASMRGREYSIQKVDSTANAVTVAAAGTDTINALASKSIDTQWGGLIVTSDGVSKWYARQTT